LCAELARRFDAYRGYADPERGRIAQNREDAELARRMLAVCNRIMGSLDRLDRAGQGDLPAARCNEELAPTITEGLFHRSPDEFGPIREIRPGLIELLVVLDESYRPMLDELALVAEAPNGPERVARLYRLIKRPLSAPGRVYLPPAWEMPAISCWLIVRDAFLTLKRRACTGHNTAAVHIAVLICQRLGFKSTSAAALSRSLKAHGLNRYN